MRLPLMLLLLTFLLCSSRQEAMAMERDEGAALLKELQTTSNLQPQQVEAKAPAVLARLRNGETMTPYFIAYNIYAENLFNQGKVEKARREIEKMVGEAMRMKDAECKVIALRTQGQFYYKLGLYESAAECFRNAMDICPRYDSAELEHCYTWSSTLFWLVQADLRTGRREEAAALLGEMDGMMEWLSREGIADGVGYKPVMVRCLKAKTELLAGNTDEARRLLQECPQYIKADVPARAYVEYYVVRMLMAVKGGRHDEALPLLDSLIAMHIADYKPIAAEFLYQKGLSLAALGRHEEGSQALRQYIALKDSVERMAVAQQLDVLTARYELEKMQHERDNMRKQFTIVLAICIALVAIITLVIISQRKLRHKNRTLARSISELNRLKPKAPAQTAAEPSAPETSAPDAEAELLETGRRVVDFITTSRCYLHPDCSRETIKEGTGITERVLAKSIVAATGLSFVNYINHLRLQVSIEMLDDKPEMTISDISTACGFGTVRQFQRIFKQRYDLTPSAYREARASGASTGDAS